jgi:hypothetical protein
MKEMQAAIGGVHGHGRVTASTQRTLESPL